MNVVSAQNPFSDRCDPEGYIPRRATEDVIRSLRSLVREGEPAIVLRGPRGIGKSMLMRILDERLSQENKVAYVSVSSAPEPELGHRVLERLQEPAASDPAEALISAARQTKDQLGRLVLLIDHAERTPIASSQQLVRAATTASPYMSVIFAISDGERADEFIEALEAQSVGILVTFDKVMDQDEAVEYLRRSLNRGDIPEGLRSRIDPETLAWIIRGADGLPREINRLALELLGRYERGDDPLVPESPEREVAAPANVSPPPAAESQAADDLPRPTTPTMPTSARAASVSASPSRRPPSLGGMLVGHRNSPEYDLRVDLDFKPSLGSGLIKPQPAQPAANLPAEPATQPVAPPSGDPVELSRELPSKPAPATQIPETDPAPTTRSRLRGMALGFAGLVGIVVGGALAFLLTGPLLENDPPAQNATEVVPRTAAVPPTPTPDPKPVPIAEEAQPPAAEELKLAARIPAELEKARSTPSTLEATPKPEVSEPEIVTPSPPSRPERLELPLAQAESLLSDAFDNLYAADLIQSLTLFTLEEDAELPIDVLKLARKHIGERIHTLGILAGAGELPEVRILSIESGFNREERYAYLPADGEEQRLSRDGGLDPLAGTQFSYEDFRPRNLDSYTVAKLEQSTLGGEAVYIVKAIPLYIAAYDQIEFFLAREDRALLEQRYFRTGQGQHYRSIQYPREFMQTVGGSLLPSKIIVKDIASGATSLARIKHKLGTGDLDDESFTLGNFRAPELDIPSP